MNYLKEILMRNPSLAIPALAAIAKMHKSNVAVAKQATRIIAHPATIEYRNKLASEVKLKPYTSTELAELYGIDKNTLKKWIKPLKWNNVRYWELNISTWPNPLKTIRCGSHLRCCII